MDLKSYLWQLLIAAFLSPDNLIIRIITYFTTLFFIIVWLLPQIKNKTDKYIISFLNRHRFRILFVLLLISITGSAYSIQNSTEIEKSRLEQIVEKQNEQVSFYFEFNDFSLTTIDKENQLFLGVTFYSNNEVIVDNLLLEVNGQQFQPLDWSPFKLTHVHSHNYIFDLAKIRSASNRDYQEAKFIAIINDAKHESSIFKIHNLL